LRHSKKSRNIYARESLTDNNWGRKKILLRTKSQANQFYSETRKAEMPDLDVLGTIRD
jgi:hypothetical protein